MARKEDIKKIHEMIKEIAPSTSMGDFGLKEQLCVELLKWKEQQMIEKAVEWLDSIMCQLSPEDPILVCNFTDFDELINDFKRYMEDKQ